MSTDKVLELHRVEVGGEYCQEDGFRWPCATKRALGDDDDEPEPTRLERHLNAAEYWLQQADLYDFPNAARTECLQLAGIHAQLAQAIATANAT